MGWTRRDFLYAGDRLRTLNPRYMLPRLSRDHPIGLGLPFGWIPKMEDLRRDARPTVVQWLGHESLFSGSGEPLP